MTMIRRERSRDRGIVSEVHRAAFGRDLEAGLLERLRGDAGWIPGLSLVAESDGRVIGHVAGTRGAIGATPAVGLGPVGVDPGRQRAGVGAALVHSLVAAADAYGFPAVVLLGSPGYYGRFGFRAAAEYGITAPDPEWGDAFQARPLAAWDPTIAGPFTYAKPFGELE